MQRVIPFVLLLVFCSLGALAAETVTIEPTQSPIQIDGDLSDSGWQRATRYETWFETNPGDNIEPSVKTIGYVTYDSRFLYVAIESFDPNPKAITAQYGDHDQISGNTDDFAGVILDTRNDGKTAFEFFLTARGVQYDAIQDDGGSGEDSAPDFFWDSSARIHDKGWTAEMRIPFSSLRYNNPNPSQWGLILYRNMPRERRYQIFTNRLPRGSSCFICHLDKVTGLRDLPSGDHIVVAPYVTANQLGQTRDGLGSPFVNRQIGGEAGLDVKWNPTADMTLDATINPDFSQVESDAAVISTNERFAIFLPEKRPFFLEGVELFSSPIQAVYTRTLTAPRWGARTTGKWGHYNYTMLVAQDRGGGSVIVPSAYGSATPLQDFSSIAAIGRVRRDFGTSFVSMLTTLRQAEGGAYNRVFGPDFLWRIGEGKTLIGQFLYSQSETPNRTDLYEEWNGQKLSGHAAYAQFTSNSPTRDFYIHYADYAKGFRADNGFIPQVDYRGSYSEAGRTWRPKGFFNRVRLYGMGEYQQTQDGTLLYRLASTGFGADGKYRSFLRLRYARDTVSNLEELADGSERLHFFDRDRLYYTVQFAVSRVVSFVSFDGWIGDEVDFVRNRLGRGSSISTSVTLRPNPHLQVALSSGIRWLGISGDRLFTAQTERIKATYTFNPRTFLRAIVQNTRTNRDVALYGGDVDQHSGSLASQLLFAYKLNWQTVFYVGYGDLQEVQTDSTHLREGELFPSNRQFFAKVSYAFQR